MFDATAAIFKAKVRPAFFRWMIFLLSLGAVGYLSYATENRPLGHFMVTSFFLLLFLILRSLTLGVMSSSLFSVSAIFLIFWGSKFKFWLTARRLHPHDIYLYFNIDNLLYAKILYPNHYVYILLGASAFVILAAGMLFFERFVKPSKFVFSGIAVLCLVYAAIVKAGPYMEFGAYGGGNRFMHFDHQHVSTFAIATIHALPELLSGKVFDYGPNRSLDPQRIAAAQAPACDAHIEGPPDLYLIMRESAMIPASLPAMGAPQVGPDMFRSSNGRTYPLRVETHGAGSAHTIFSVLTGLSSESFGPLMNIGIDLSINRIKASLPQILKKCGYRTIAITTGMDGYVLERKFYKSIEFDEYYDIRDVQKLSNNDISDSAVYALAQSVVTKANPEHPLFVYIDTTAAHGPYTYKIKPEVDLPEARARDAEATEYVRRLILGERDFQAYLARLSAQVSAGGRRTLVTDFGDHHPSLTKYLPGRNGFINHDRRADDELLITFFRLTSLGFQLPELPAHPLVDAAFVGDWLLHASGLPIGGVYRQRWEMIERCASRYWRCEQETQAYELHQTLRAAGFLSIP